MKCKIFFPLILILVLTFVFMPMTVKAGMENGNDLPLQHNKNFDSIDGETVLSTVSTGICHCGGNREETVYLRVDLAYCPAHGVSCRNYYVFYKQTYFYCTNPYCGDNWYSDWEAYYSEHDYG